MGIFLHRPEHGYTVICFCRPSVMSTVLGSGTAPCSKSESPNKLSVLRLAGVRKCQKTNLENKGLISADRNNKATLLLTIPRSVFKSSAKDLSPPISCIMFQRLQTSHFRALGSLTFMMLDMKRHIYL